MKPTRLLALALLSCLAACADDSYAVVSVLAREGSVDGVAQFRVHVTSGSSVDVLEYPQQPTHSMHLDTSHPITLSVEFSASRAGQATFEVEPLDAHGTSLAYGKSTVAIAKGSVVDVTVRVALGALRPEYGLDAGAAGDGGSSQLSCNPYAPPTACGANQTCALLCTEDQPAVAMCYAAGPGKPGNSCAKDSDCEPGSQCFTAAGCSVMTCLRYCDGDDAMCGEQDSHCNVPIACGTTAPFSACSRPCDPTPPGTTGCATGLSCFVYAGETTDCACTGLGDVGATCTQNSGCGGEAGCAGCRSGLSCVVPTGAATGAGSGTCRPVCSLATLICPTGMTCHAFAGSTRLVYGFCQ